MVNEDSILGVFLVAKGTKGDRLLFLYPFAGTPTVNDPNLLRNSLTSPYYIRIREDTVRSCGPRGGESTVFSKTRLSEEMMSYMFTVRSELCGQRFEMQIEDYVYAGFPLLVSQEFEHSTPEEMPTIILFQIVFILPSGCSRELISNVQDVSRNIAIAIDNEETRSGYLAAQAKIMIDCLEEVAAMPESEAPSPYPMILKQSELALQLKNMFEDLTQWGICSLLFNGWVEVSYCLIKHVLKKKSLPIESAESVETAVRSIKPYHGLLLLENVVDMLSSLPLDSCSALTRLIRVHSPYKSLQQLSTDTDLPMSQIFFLSRHLVLWGKALIIFPLCEPNFYVIARGAPLNHTLSESFGEEYAGSDLFSILADFSSGLTLADFTNSFHLSSVQRSERMRMLMWLLQRRLIVQMHTYMYHLPPTNIEHLHERHESGNRNTLTLNLDQAEERNEAKDILKQVLKDRGESLVAALHVVSNIKSSTIVDDVKLFVRLLPYLNGEHHVEDVMYRENLRRAEVSRIVDLFSAIVVTCKRPDNTAIPLVTN